MPPNTSLAAIRGVRSARLAKAKGVGWVWMLGLMLWASSGHADRSRLSQEQRLDCQAQIEDIRWAHRIWPKDNPGPKPERGELMDEAAIRTKVAAAQQLEVELDESYGISISQPMLQAELNRIASHTQAPDQLQQIFTALGNDPYQIAECLVRPELAKGLLQDARSGKPGTTPSRINRHEIKAEAHIEQPLRLPKINAASLKPEQAADAGVWLNYGVTERSGHKAVWTGSEMIVWGGAINSGDRYDPVTDQWTSMAQLNAPINRVGHSAIWTGKELILWGGADGASPNDELLNSGGRYDPALDLWLPTNQSGAPNGKQGHAAVWTGSEMIIWGGFGSGIDVFNAWSYSPSGDVWMKLAAPLNFPYLYPSFTPVWTGSEMIVWGSQYGASNPELAIGARYHRQSNTWKLMSTANQPSQRHGATAVWTGGEMIVWGGQSKGQPLGDGGRYNPVTDTWQPVSLASSPGARQKHTAVWTGSQMLVWGGIGIESSYLNTGGRYNPASDSWIAIGPNNAPSARKDHSAVWTGQEMIVWGGTNQNGWLSSGGRYNPITGIWRETQGGDVPISGLHSGVWTGAEALFFHLIDAAGWRYDPVLDDWMPIATAAWLAGDTCSATPVWSGSEAILWCGFEHRGGRYDPVADHWQPMNANNQLVERFWHHAFWIGSEMLVWGGITHGDFMGTDSETLDGAKYDPVTDQWQKMSAMTPASSSRDSTVVWTGAEMIVWDGDGNGSQITGGSRYDPVDDSWSTTSALNAPAGRIGHASVWTGTEMLVWGGVSD